MPKVVIVGGGISGLSLAYHLEQRTPGVEVVVLESASRLGGKVGTELRDGFVVEMGPNGFLDNKPFALALATDVGLKNQLLPASDAAAHNRFIFLGDKLRALPTGILAFLRSEVLSWRGKLNILAERFRSPKRDGDDESVAAFFRRRIGDEATEKLADAFVTGIYAGDPELLSLRASFPRLAAFERQAGSLLRGMARAARQRRREAAIGDRPPTRGNQMWSFCHGLGTLIERLRERLQIPPIQGVKVCRIERGRGSPTSDSHAWTVHGEGRDRWSADAVVLTCPAAEQAAILGEHDPVLGDQIAGIPYVSVAVVALGYRRQDVPGSLEGFGYLVPQRARRDVLGVQWCSSIFPDRAPQGTVLLRAMCGGWHRAEMVGWDDDRLVRAVAAELRLAMGIKDPPIFHHIIRWERAIPQYLCGHLERVRIIEERAAALPGLFVAGNCYYGVALNDCVEQGELLAGGIARYLSQTRS